MAPPKTLVTAVCVILAAPLSYAVYRSGSLFSALVTLVVVGIVLPRLYRRFEATASGLDPEGEADSIIMIDTV